MRLLILTLVLFSLSTYGQPPQKEADKLVNKHLKSSSKKKEFQKQRANIQTRKHSRMQPPAPQPTPNPAETQGVQLEQEPNAFTNEKTTDIYKPLRDPGSDIRNEVFEEKTEYTQTEHEKQMLIKKIKSEAEKSGYKVNVIGP